MDYQKHYDKLMEKGRNRNLKDQYTERHHIVPRCHGGSDNVENLVALTPEEHFVAHQLLVKIYPLDKKLMNALSKMCSSSSKNPRTNKWYGWIRKRYSESVAGENNPSAKFTNEQVIEIYYSSEDLDILCKKYNCIRYNIISIKRKIYYRNVTKDIKELPGFPEKCGSTTFPIPIDLIEDIFYDTGDYEYFYEKYRATKVVVRNIKKKISFKKITSKLGIPGQVKRYGLTQDMVSEIFRATGTNKEIAEKYGIHYNTVRNIKGKYSRAFNMWEEF
jgi:hypothetical protein